ncbi:MAG: hypothetical protein ABI409_08725, partial [Ramlibacter sp.]
MSAHRLVAATNTIAFDARCPKRGWVHSNGPLLIHAFSDADAAALVFALRMTSRALQLQWTREHVLLALLAVACFMLVASPATLYRSWRSSSIIAELLRVLYCCIVTIASVAATVELIGSAPAMIAPMFVLWGISSFTAIALGRIAVRLGLRTWRASGRNFRTAVIVGAGEVAQQLAEQLQARPWMGIRLVGVAKTVADYKIIKAQQPLDVVYIALPLRMHRHIQKIVQ